MTCHYVKYLLFPFRKYLTNMYNFLLSRFNSRHLKSSHRQVLRFMHLLQEASLSVLHSCSLTSEGKVLKRLSSTIKQLLFSNLHSPSSTGRPSSLFPLSSSCVRLVSSPNRDGRACRQLFPRFSVRNFLHWNNSGGSASIYEEK